MLEKSFGLFFYLKQAKNQKNEKRYVYLRITVNGSHRELSIKRQWVTNQWDSSLGRATGESESALELNSYLELLSCKVYQAKIKLIENNKPITAQGIKEVLLGEDEKQYFIMAAFLEHNVQMQALVGVEVAAGTLTRYKTAYSHVGDFIKWKYKKDDMNVGDLNYEFITQLLFWLKSKKKCNHNTAIKYIGNFKKIVLECLRREWLKRDPFIGFKAKRQEVIPVALTKEEVLAISNKRFKIERIIHVRDIFLFCCYTGLAYIDVYNLKDSDITIGIDGEKWIITTRQKTNSFTRLPLLPPALKILAKYENHPKCISNGTILPVLTNQKMNSYLKEIADTCGIKKNLTFHTARHTFATTVTLTNGVPIETVSKMLGHKSLKQTQHYAKIVDVKISEDMKQLKKRLELI
jgi:integrase